MLTKQPVNISFSNGLNTKIDPFQIPVGQFEKLENSVFTTGSRLTKRNGYGELTSLPNTTYTYLTTFSNGLVAVGSSLSALSSSTNAWINKGSFVPLTLGVLPTVRSALSQIQCDSIIASNGLVCTVYTENSNGTSLYKYTIEDSNDGQVVVPQTSIPVSSGTITGSPRVFVLGGYFIIAFTNTISAVVHLQYIAISINSPSTIVQANTDIASVIAYSSTVNWDAVTVGQSLYFAYNTTAGGQQIDFSFLTSSLALSGTTSFTGSIATIMSVTADTTTSSPVIYASFWDAASSTGHTIAVNTSLQTVMTPTSWLGSGSVANVATAAQLGTVTIFYENINNYSYDSALPSNFVSQNMITLPLTVTTGTLGTAAVVKRSVGLASKAFIFNKTIYALLEYSSVYQPTYFLVDLFGNIIAKLAYENGGASTAASSGYLKMGLPQAEVLGSTVSIAYLYKDLISSVNKTQGSSISAGVYSQTGVNLGSFSFDSTTLSTSEIGANLNLSGGYLYAYDGNSITEQGFHLWPDNIETSWSTTGGSIAAQPDATTNTNAYFYQVIYQQTDAQGNIFNSAPSIPVSVTTTGSGTTGSITLHGPMLRVTSKGNVKIIIYRWSVAQEEYFQVTSLSNPLLNVTTADSWIFIDTLADASIAGNGLIYTTGGVVEDIGAPACTAITLFDTRLWLINAEDQNLLLYSKQVIEGTPVEMSDLFTFYIAPNTGTTSSTGPMKCLAPMDDKLIIFKKDAIYYINGTGPDNTGANSQYSQAIFITSTVGSVNQNSLVLMPMGLMFQSDKGIWLLGRDLSTQYIGAAVESFNQQTVTSAVAIPGTTQVRFTLDKNTVLMYDYFYQQWGTFINVNAVSSTLYESLHTYISNFGGVSQETSGVYLDNGNPVLMNITTGWLNLAGLQGYQLADRMYLLGTYLTPFNLSCSVAYNYNPSIYQTSVINPNNFSSNASSPFGDNPAPFGAQSAVFSWRMFFAKKRCSAIQISINEIYDPSKGIAAGAGFTLSGINMLVALKSGWRTQSSNSTVGGGVNRG